MAPQETNNQESAGSPTPVQMPQELKARSPGEVCPVLHVGHPRGESTRGPTEGRPARDTRPAHAVG